MIYVLILFYFWIHVISNQIIMIFLYLIFLFGFMSSLIKQSWYPNLFSLTFCHCALLLLFWRICQQSHLLTFQTLILLLFLFQYLNYYQMMLFWLAHTFYFSFRKFSVISEWRNPLVIWLIIDASTHARSEERRVGKECQGLCRSRWSPYH